MKNEENFMENLVTPAPKLFGNKIVRRRNCSVEKSCSLSRTHIHNIALRQRI